MVVRVTKTEFELDDGRIFPHPVELDDVPTIERESYRYMKKSYYDNGEEKKKKKIKDEDWYGYYEELIEISMSECFTFEDIKDPKKLVDLFNKGWAKIPKREDFPTEEQLLRWAVLISERHNNTYCCPLIINSFREDYKALSKTMKDWTDWDVVKLEIAIVEKEFKSPERYRQVKERGGLPKNKIWIYDKNNTLTKHIDNLIVGFTKIGIFEQHPEECQWRWKQ